MWEDFWAISNKWTMSPPSDLTEKALDERFRITAVRALLQIADVRASIQEKETENWVPDPAALRFAYTFPYDRPRGVQEAVKEGWDRPAMILRAPTGSGKDRCVSALGGAPDRVCAGGSMRDCDAHSVYVQFARH